MSLNQSLISDFSEHYLGGEKYQIGDCSFSLKLFGVSALHTVNYIFYMLLNK